MRLICRARIGGQKFIGGTEIHRGQKFIEGGHKFIGGTEIYRGDRNGPVLDQALALATKFNGHITRDEEQYQNLVLVVEAYRKKFSIIKKSDLRRL